MVFWTIVLLWAGLSILFLVRFRNIMQNLHHSLHWRSIRLFGREVIGWPVIESLRPMRQLLVWLVELLVLIWLYEILGVAVLSHVVAAIICAALMILMRDRQAGSPLKSVQLVPDHFRLGWSGRQSCVSA